MVDRGQTETLGFALVFALMISSIIIVFTAGYGSLQEVRDVERVNNAERAFEVFADNMEDITHRNAPSRATEIKLSSARLSFGEPITVRVADTDAGFDQSLAVRPIVYDAEGPSQLVYAQGAVLRTRDGAGLVAHEATILMNGNRTVIPVVQTRQESGSKVGVGGDATVLIRATHVDTDVLYTAANDGATIWFNITSPRANTWARYLDRQSDVGCSAAGGVANCSVTTDRVSVTVVRIDVELT